MMSSTPWAEYMALAQELADGKPHHGPGGNLRRYQQLAFERSYSTDTSLEAYPHAWLLELGVGIIPHTSGHNGPTTYSGGKELDSGSFWHHLRSNGALHLCLYKRAVCSTFPSSACRCCNWCFC